jgi:hypothetical protein
MTEVKRKTSNNDNSGAFKLKIDHSVASLSLYVLVTSQQAQLRTWNLCKSYVHTDLHYRHSSFLDPHNLCPTLNFIQFAHKPNVVACTRPTAAYINKQKITTHARRKLRSLYAVQGHKPSK